MDTTLSEAKPKKIHDPAVVIDAYCRRIRGIRICAVEVVPKAREIQLEQIKKSAIAIGQCAGALNDGHPKRKAQSITSLIRESAQITLHDETPYDRLILESLLKSAFGAFDAYVGELLRTMYQLNDGLLRKIEKQLGIVDLLEVSNVEGAKELLIEKDIESLLRESYPTQFEQLAKRFGVETLTKFPNWPKFVESSQRRNAITHCDGKANAQYFIVCKRYSVKVPDEIKIGTRLDVSIDYLCECLDVLYEVGFKLGQVLWRKGHKDGVKDADSHLINGIVEILQREDWGIASSMSEFAVNHTKPFNDMNRRMMLVNHAQALHWAGRKQESLNFIKGHDWTGAIRDLRLAVAVLEEKYSDASALMLQIGRKGEIVDCRGYVDWPIFRDFRLSLEFRNAFLAVYEVPFDDEVKKLESETIASVEAKVTLEIDHATTNVQCSQHTSNLTPSHDSLGIVNPGHSATETPRKKSVKTKRHRP
jgi:hypothetical protein